jgi:serine beta-lactamase-like protein LACTB
MTLFASYLLAAALAAQTSNPCEPIVDEKWRAQVTTVHDSVTALMERERAPGVAIAVMKNGSLVWSEGFGFANRETAQPICRTTQFRAGSVSKVITAAALLRLADQNKIQLEADVRRYVPSFPDKGHVITLRQLATHLGGIRHYGRSDYINTRRYQSMSEALNVFATDTLIAAPGTRYFYSSFGYNLLGAALEGAAGTSFPLLIEQLILKPIGMHDTALETLKRDSSKLTRFYSRRDTVVTESGPQDTSDRWPSGGFVSTAEDVAKLGAALITTHFLSDSARSLLLTESTVGGKPTGYAIGLRVGKDASDRFIAHHGGVSIGGRAFLLIYPEEQLVIALLANTEAGFSEKQLAVIARPFLQ